MTIQLFSGADSLSNLDSVRAVKSKNDLSGVLRSDIAYFIDGIIDMQSQSITIPAGGLTLIGNSFDISRLTSSADNHTMFISPIGGSGNLLGVDFAIEVTGTASKVYDIHSASGFEAVELIRVNYNNCTSLGEINNYRQGLETGTGRFGGSPTLTLSGVWLGGFRIGTSLTRSLSSSMTTPLFTAGDGFLMYSRFFSDMNVDLPTNAPFLDFYESNFVNTSTLQLRGCIVTRDGVFNPSDANITPNISKSSPVSSWADNVGMPNTFEGGKLTLTTQIATPIGLVDTFVDLEGTWAESDMQHFTTESNGRFQHLGDSPREFSIMGDITLEGRANDECSVRVSRWDTQLSAFVQEALQYKRVISLTGSRDIAQFIIFGNVTLDKNEYIKFEIANHTGTRNLTAELGSYITIVKR
jgi:hypothetical protein